jgi:diguanylate cyclase (GGDEF)-like protein
VGDQVIRAAASMLRDQARLSDPVARVGGDEFLVLLPETDRRGAARFVARARAAARRARLEGGQVLEISLGAATAAADESLAAAIRRADLAMYAAKKRRAARRTRQTAP